jgi:IMP-specific 5'-nucleotidase
MKNMLSHSFVLDCLETTGADTFTHFEVLIDEHRRIVALDGNGGRPSRLKQLVPTVGTFHTRLPLRQAFELYNAKHQLTKRKHIQISFNEVRLTKLNALRFRLAESLLLLWTDVAVSSTLDVHCESTPPSRLVFFFSRLFVQRTSTYYFAVTPVFWFLTLFTSVHHLQLRHILNLAQILAMRTVHTDLPDSVSRGWLYGSVRNVSYVGGGTVLTVGGPTGGAETTLRPPNAGSSSTCSSSTTTAPLTSDGDNDHDSDDAIPPSNDPNNNQDDVVNSERSSNSCNLADHDAIAPGDNKFINRVSGIFQPTPMGEEFNGPKMITFDGDQTLYSDGSNFDSNPALASYLCQLLKHGVIVAVVTAAGYEYNVEKYEFRLSGLLRYFKAKELTAEECERFLLFGGECNYLLHVRDTYSW